MVAGSNDATLYMVKVFRIKKPDLLRQGQICPCFLMIGPIHQGENLSDLRFMLI